MKIFILCASLFLGISLLSCKKDDDVITYDYHAHIAQPSSSDKNIGDNLFIDVEFESHTGENVEHINVKIFDKANPSVIVYDKPDNAHAPDDVSVYNFQDQFVLSAANGLYAGDWILEAKVWGEHDGLDEVTEQVEFHINP